MGFVKKESKKKKKKKDKIATSEKAMDFRQTRVALICTLPI